MIFNSLEFIIFFIVTFLVYYIIKFKYRNLVLLIASYFFYGYSNPKHLIILVFVTLISYFAAILINKTKNINNKKTIIFFTTLVLIGTLIYFKYLTFIFESVNHIFNARFSIENIIVPLGISFFILQALSYPIDVYRGDVEVEKNIINYAAFVSYFPSILSGPINKSKQLLPQFRQNRLYDSDAAHDGLVLCLYGFFQKLVIADCIAIGVNNVYSNLGNYNGFSLIITAILYSFQIYFDFSSYSKIAYGISKMLGFDIIKNFNSPYLADSIKSFWSKWHISLSTWFKEYLYIPIGGNKKGEIRTYINIMIVFIISGLWHGAAYTYLIWGFLHGFYQIIERKFKIKIKSKIVGTFLTFILVTFAWIFFRSNTISDAFYFISHMFNISFISIRGQILSIGLDKYDIIVIVVGVLLNFSIELLDTKIIVLDRLRRLPILIRYAIYLIVIFGIIVFGSYGPGFDSSQFIYLGY